MIIKFSTKRDRNGNRYYLILDTDKKQYSKTASGFYHKDDYIEVTKREKHSLEIRALADDYKEVDSI